VKELSQKIEKVARTETIGESYLCSRCNAPDSDPFIINRRLVHSMRFKCYSKVKNWGRGTEKGKEKKILERGF